MNDRCVGNRGRLRSGERRVRVAVDDHGVGAFPTYRVEDAWAHRLGIRGLQPEPVIGVGEPELVEEDLRELVIVVLPGVKNDFLDTRVAQRNRQRRRLDELRPVSNDGEHAHRGLHYAPARAVSSALH